MRTFKKSTKLDHVCYDIRGPVMDEANRLSAQGCEILKLNIGNPAPFALNAPEYIEACMKTSLEASEGYSDSKGILSAREAIAAYCAQKQIQGVTPDDIYTGNGVSELISIAMQGLLDNGDEILVPAPDYPLWTASIVLSGGVPVHYICDEASDWYPDIEDMRRKITPKTKGIVIINPNNPTGALYPDEILLKIVDLAREHDLILFSDEIYDRLVMDGKTHTSIAALAPDVFTITMNGLSKSHIICGFRCGWMVFSGPKAELAEVEQGVTALASMRLCGNTLTQLVIPAALQDRDSTRAMMLPGGRLYEQSKATVEGLRKIPGVTLVPNRAAFYLFPGLEAGAFDFESDEDFAMKFLHEKHILVIPGHGFDWFEDLRFRIVMLPEPERITAAMASLGEFLDEHRR